MPRNPATFASIAWGAVSALLLSSGVARASDAALAATFTMSTTTPHVGEAIVFDGSASVCDNPTGCAYTWQWFWRSADGTTSHLGGQMGQSPTITYAFDAFAASKPYVIVTLRVTAGRLVAPSQAQRSFALAPATADAGAGSIAPLHLSIRNAPDPFRGPTTVRYTLPAAGDVQIAVYDLGGRRVRQLVTRHEPAGDHSVVWDGLTDRGEAAKGGVYFARIVTPTGVARDPLTLTR